jgi:hypothetical protein
MPQTPTVTALGNGSTTTSPLTIPVTNTAGQDLIAIFSRNSATDFYTSVTDNTGGTWTMLQVIPTSGTVGRRIEMWVRYGAPTITSVIAAFAGTQSAQGVIIQAGNLKSGAQTGQNASVVRAASVTPAELQITPSMNGMLAIAAVQWNANVVSGINAEAGWTKGTSHNNGPAWAWRTNLPAGVADGCSWTAGSSVGSGHVIATFVPADDVVPEGPTVTVWNGTSEVAVGSVTLWNGTSEVPVNVDLTM